MKSLRNPGVLLSTVMLGLAIGATPLAQADTAPATEATHNQTTKASTSKLPVEESDKTYVEYRSEADREAFEKANISSMTKKDSPLRLSPRMFAQQIKTALPGSMNLFNRIIQPSTRLDTLLLPHTEMKQRCPTGGQS